MSEREETRDEYLDREEQHEREQDAREIAFLRAEVELLSAERDGAFTRYDALLWQIANEGCVSARVGEGTRECGLPVCGLCRIVNDRDFYRENSAALGHALEIGNAKIEDLRAEVERLKNDLRRATDLLSSAKHGYRSDSPMRARITEFLTGPAEEDGRDE